MRPHHLPVSVSGLDVPALLGAIVTSGTETVSIRVHPRLFVVALLSAITMALLTIDGMFHPIAPFDLAVIQVIQRIDPGPLLSLIHAVDVLTDSTWAPVAWLVMVIVLLRLRQFAAALVAGMMPIGGVVNHLIGVYLVTRTRPDDTEVIRTIGEWNAPSFPSGHVMGAVMLYGFALYLVMGCQNRLMRILTVAGSLVILGGVGFGRIWLGAHWPSDVVAAYALGTLSVGAMIVMHRALVAVWQHDRCPG